MGMLHKPDCQEQMICACGSIIYDRGRHRLGQGHDNCICQAKELPFYPKPKVLPTAKVFQDWIG